MVDVGTNLDPELRQLVAVIVGDADPLEVILFGSEARGSANAESDFDVAVVMPEGTHRMRTAQSIYRALRQVRGRRRGIDIVVLTAGEVSSGRADPGTITRALHREGRTLYRRATGSGV